MNNSGAKLPYENSKIANLLRDRIQALQPKKSQREIAAEIGYDKPNVLSMYKRGEAKVPLDRIPAFAKALQVDAGHLFRLALEQYWPGQEKVIQEIFGGITTRNQRDWLDVIEDVLSESDPVMTPPRAQALRTALGH